MMMFAIIAPALITGATADRLKFAGYAETYATMIIGGLAGLICHLALRLKQFLRLDDALDVTAIHFAAGVLGTFLLGFSFCLTWTRQARVSCGLAVLGVWAACGAVKVNLCRRQGGGFRQTGSVLSVALFGAAGRHGSPRS